MYTTEPTSNAFLDTTIAPRLSIFMARQSKRFSCQVESRQESVIRESSRCLGCSRRFGFVDSDLAKGTVPIRRRTDVIRMRPNIDSTPSLFVNGIAESLNVSCAHCRKYMLC